MGSGLYHLNKSVATAFLKIKSTSQMELGCHRCTELMISVLGRINLFYWKINIKIFRRIPIRK